VVAIRNNSQKENMKTSFKMRSHMPLAKREPLRSFTESWKIINPWLQILLLVSSALLIGTLIAMFWCKNNLPGVLH